MKDRMTSAIQEARMLRWASVFARGYNLYLRVIGAAGYERMMRQSIEELQGRRAILDVGTGTGLAGHLARTSHPEASITAIDLSLDFLRRAKKRISTDRLTQGSVLLLPFKDEQFDAVLSFGVLCHLVEPERSLTEIYRVLRRGGYLLLWTRGTDRWGRMLRMTFPLFGGGAIFTLYTREEMLDLFEKAGFQQIIVHEEAHGLLVKAMKPAS
jgi:ubiquinone/menaquinone biosynthesis C-methylase UbiE